jgi:hypothetical protein
MKGFGGWTTMVFKNLLLLLKLLVISGGINEK